MADTIIEKFSPSQSPEGLFHALRDHPYVFFLDSALIDERLGRFSFLGCDPFLIFRSKKDSVSLEWADGRRESFKSNPFLALKRVFKKYECKNSDRGLPFVSGGVGYFSYDLKDFTEELPDVAVDDLGLDDCVMGFYDTVIIYDNLAGCAHIASSGLPYSGARQVTRQRERLKEFRGICSAHFPARHVSCLAGSRQDFNRRRENVPYSSLSATEAEGALAGLKSNFSKSGYISAVGKAKQYIKKGDIYQVNLSQRFDTDIGIDPSELYLKLRSVSPAPFASYLGFGDTAILSSSPERFLLKNKNYIETRPIKGTRPRGRNAADDLALERELKLSAKDNAEHIMIVDLERNDLGRICDYGTINLDEKAIVEKYANVFHLVSTVSGTLKKDAGPVDCLMATFPGGSITGAPKVRSMEIIESLEPVKRSLYTGAIGYIGFDGGMDTSIVIRTIIIRGDKAYFSVGGGIVADSDPESEYQETLDKAAGIIKALVITSNKQIPMTNVKCQINSQCPIRN